MKLKQSIFRAVLTLAAAGLVSAGPVWAGTCAVNGRTTSICTYTAGQEGVHRIIVTAPQPDPATLAGHACGKAVRDQNQRFQAVCYAYLNSGATYSVAAPDQAIVEVTPAEPAPGSIVIIP